MDIIFGSSNVGKIKEVKEILTGYNVFSLKDMGLAIEVVEDGETFEENARKKAWEIMKATGKNTLADDSGIEIDFLDRRPGVLSARFLGEDTPYDFKNGQIIEMLKDAGQDKRTARYVCVMAFCRTDGEVVLTRGEIEGEIGFEQKGNNGFGYDPIFYLPEYKKTMAELSDSQKNEISHRRLALNKLRQILEAQQ